MKSLYKKYDGMLMTFPDDLSEDELNTYRTGGRSIQTQKYDKNTFDRLTEQAQKYTFSQIVYIDGRKKDDDGITRAFTPENMVIRGGQLYAVRYYRPCAVGHDTYVIPLCEMEAGPCLASSHTDRYDDYGDHDSWHVNTYIKMTISDK